jgi:hypothetical protein
LQQGTGAPTSAAAAAARAGAGIEATPYGHANTASRNAGGSSSSQVADLIKWRHVCFGSSVAAMSKGCSMQQLQHMLLKSSVCSRVFDRASGQVYSRLPAALNAAAAAKGPHGGLRGDTSSWVANPRRAAA